MSSPIRPGQRIFIDSNIFIYHFLGTMSLCSDLLARVEAKDIRGFTSVIVVAEVWHRLMIAEVIEIYKISPTKAVSYLKSHPQIVKELSKCHFAITSISALHIKIWPLTERVFGSAQLIIKRFGLLTNDALNLALMKSHKVKNIATNDRDFEHIKDISVYRP